MQSEHHAICIWNASTSKSGRAPYFEKPRDQIGNLTFSPDGQRIASVDARDSTIRVWNTSTGALEGIFTRHSDEITSIAFSPDENTLVSGSQDGALRLWNVLTGKFELQKLFVGHNDTVWSVSFSANVKLIVSGSLNCTLCLWDVFAGRLAQCPLIGYTDLVITTAFSPDGKWIASGSRDLTIRVWNASSEESMHVLPTGHIADITSVLFSPDSMQIVSCGEDHTIRVFPAHPIVITSTGISFNDLSIIDSDGWIHGEHGDLLLWIPSLHRAGLYQPNIPLHSIGQNQTRLDTSSSNLCMARTGLHVILVHDSSSTIPVLLCRVKLCLFSSVRPEFYTITSKLNLYEPL